MLNKTTTLALLLSLAATQGIFASDAKEDLGSNPSSSPRTSSPATPVDSDDSSSSLGVFLNLDNVELDTLEEEIPDLHTTLKDLDQHGSQYAGQKLKDLVSEKLPGGKAMVQVAALVAKNAFGTETLTEGVLDLARKPLKLDPENYPTTTAGIVGQKVKKLVDLLPYGTKITAVAGKAGKTFFGTETLTEGLIEKFIAKKNENPKVETSDTAAEEEVKVSSSVESKEK